MQEPGHLLQGPDRVQFRRSERIGDHSIFVSMARQQAAASQGASKLVHSNRKDQFVSALISFNPIRCRWSNKSTSAFACASSTVEATAGE